MKTITTLQSVLFINALSSGATGLLLLFFPGYISDLFASRETLPFVIVGIFLSLFAGLVYLQSRKTVVHKGWVKFIIAMDILWVVESVLILVPQLFNFSAIGYFLIAAVAVWVAGMVILQTKGLKQATTFKP